MRLILICKPESESFLADELGARVGASGISERFPGDGMFAIGAETSDAAPWPPDRPFIFERQRIEDAVFIPAASCKVMAHAIVKQLLPPITLTTAPWTTHIFRVPIGGAGSGSARPLEAALLDFIRDRFPRVARRYVPPHALPCADPRAMVLNVASATQGAWGAAMPAMKLSDPHRGGIHRMPDDPAAPARSYLKLEEAFDLLGVEPRKGESVIDLGAAPGGWSYACLKRGCRVLAVDNGPMRILNPDRHGGSLTHVRRDGLTFAPDAKWLPADWLISDMLVSAGRNIGMLRQWFAERRMRRFVVNIKLPQVQPYPALQPLESFLAALPGIRYRLRELYHDRREVTLSGSLE